MRGKGIKKTTITSAGKKIPVFTGEFWTAGQRQAANLHEISYRACFKPALPAYFIDEYSDKGEIIYDPFSGRGTTIIEAALKGRNIISNDVNPLSRILTEPRLNPPDEKLLIKRLDEIFENKISADDHDLKMFFQKQTLYEILQLRTWLNNRKKKNDQLDSWIRMVATNRLTGHSPGFFSVYTLPPNQAVSRGSQRKINKKRKQIPEYRDVKKLILKKSRSLEKGLTSKQIKNLEAASSSSLFLNKDASATKEIPDNAVQLTITSPPFLNVVHYANDNWLRCWFNQIDAEKIEKKITTPSSIPEWENKMQQVFRELYRITKKNGIVAFEVGEVRNGKIKLEEIVLPLGEKAGFRCKHILINSQQFTKTANIWGVANNVKGTNSNRIVVFEKG